MLNKTFFLIAVCFTVVITANSQTDSLKRAPDSLKQQTPDTIKYWKKGGFSSLTFNQVSLSNWVAGGENALSSTAVLNLFANYKKGKTVWDNSLDLGYGLLKTGSKSPRKNEDKIELQSKFGHKAAGKFYYSAFLNYRSQFANGYNYPNDTTRIFVSKFNAPGYLSLSLGMDYKPTDFLSIYFSPAAGKATFVTDTALSRQGMYGVEPGKKLRAEFGASLNMKFQKDVIKNVNVSSKLALFNNYTDKDKSNRKNIDVNWEVMVNIKANKFLTTSIMTNLIYDQNVLKKTQFKEVFGVGLSYKF
jgi:hypothetical protein